MAENLIAEVFEYVKYISPLLLIIGGISMADIIITILINVFKKHPYADLVDK